MTTATIPTQAAKVAALANALRMIDRSRGFERAASFYENEAIAGLADLASKPRIWSGGNPLTPSWSDRYEGPFEQDEWAADYRASAL